MAVESPLVKRFASAVNSLRLSYVARIHEALYYEMPLNRRIEAAEKPRLPNRGSGAFQVDLAIGVEREDPGGAFFTPLLAIEFKTQLTTHDVITYSAKAIRTKQVYPWLRYGLIIEGGEMIPGRFFTHNQGLDFAVAAKGYLSEGKFAGFVRALVVGEAALSDELERARGKNRSSTECYRSRKEFGRFGALFRVQTTR
ncbi:MAG TPA: hypothetical protein VN934_10450 [Candidatus Tumulicola sp.]|nr:hypothetical protein [Candidatus Tumulicola sp.]